MLQVVCLGQVRPSDLWATNVHKCSKLLVQVSPAEVLHQATDLQTRIKFLEQVRLNTLGRFDNFSLHISHRYPANIQFLPYPLHKHMFGQNFTKHFTHSTAVYTFSTTVISYKNFRYLADCIVTFITSPSSFFLGTQEHYVHINTVRSESRCALRHKQICRKCWRIKLNGFRPVQTLMVIPSNTFYKCTANFRNSPPVRHRVPSHFNWTLPQRKCTATFRTQCIRVTNGDCKCNASFIVARRRSVTSLAALLLYSTRKKQLLVPNVQTDGQAPEAVPTLSTAKPLSLLGTDVSFSQSLNAITRLPVSSLVTTLNELPQVPM